MQKMVRCVRSNKCFEWLMVVLFSICLLLKRDGLRDLLLQISNAFCKSGAAIVKHEILSPAVGLCFKIYARTCTALHPWNT